MGDENPAEKKGSLSTIAEEPNPAPDHESMSSSSSSGSLEKPESFIRKTPQPFPPFPEPIPSRKKRHTSTVMKKFPEALPVPHDRGTTLDDRIIPHIHMSGKPLFATVLDDVELPKTPSFLVTGFGLRNLSSLQRALQIQEFHNLKELYAAQPGEAETVSSPSSSSVETHKTASSETEECFSAAAPQQKERLEYLMGIQMEAEEEEAAEEKERPRAAVEEPKQLSESMKNAQKYLKVHRIFEFFQFVVAHLLSSLPENPVEFIMDLLDKCLIYRTGLDEPPLLYDKKHLESLFYLMDKMRTGYIELEQYRTGMHTLGICSYNQSPPLTSDGMVAKDVFIEEAYDALTDALNEMLRRRWLKVLPPITPPPPPTPQISIQSSRSTADEMGATAGKSGIFFYNRRTEF